MRMFIRTAKWLLTTAFNVHYWPLFSIAKTRF